MEMKSTHSPYQHYVDVAISTLSNGPLGRSLYSAAKKLMTKGEVDSMYVYYFFLITSDHMTLKVAIDHMKTDIRREINYYVNVEYEGNDVGREDRHIFEEYDSIPFDGIQRIIVILLMCGFPLKEISTITDTSLYSLRLMIKSIQSSALNLPEHHLLKNKLGLIRSQLSV